MRMTSQTIHKLDIFDRFAPWQEMRLRRSGRGASGDLWMNQLLYHKHRPHPHGAMGRITVTMSVKLLSIRTRTDSAEAVCRRTAIIVKLYGDTASNIALAIMVTLVLQCRGGGTRICLERLVACPTSPCPTRETISRILGLGLDLAAVDSNGHYHCVQYGG
jgi:hypothetical protein